MTYRKLIVPVGLAAALLITPVLASAQGRGRAAPRGAVRAVRPPARVLPSRPLSVRPYYSRPYYPGVGLGFYSGFGYGYPFGYDPFFFGPSFYGSSYYGPYASGYPGYGYGPYRYAPYGYAAYVGRPYGGVRIDLPQRDAEVYADGYFAGRVDDFDGKLQQLDLEPGPHRIEIRDRGFETISFDVNVDPGRTITYRASMIPAP